MLTEDTHLLASARGFVVVGSALGLRIRVATPAKEKTEIDEFTANSKLKIAKKNKN